MEKGEGAKKAVRPNAQTFLWSVDYVPAEQNLETIGYFAARYTRKKVLDESQLSRLVSLSDNRRIEIIPSAKYGFPNAEDLDFYRAFLKICDERAKWVKIEHGSQVSYHPQLPSPIAFSSRELIVKAGRHKSHRELRAVRDWIERLSATLIRGELFDAKEKKFDVRIGFEPLFKQFVHVGRLMSDGTRAAQNYVWLAQWFIDNYFYFYSRPFDLKFHQRLKHAIAKTLYPLLDNAWYASNGAPYTKSYPDLCLLLDLKPHTQLSRVRHQLDASNEELIREHFVAKYDYPLRPNGEWSGNVRWWPGGKWLHDQEQKQSKQAREINGAAPLPAQSPSSPQGDREDPSQQVLPLSPTRKVSNADPAEVRVRTFYQQLGQSRPSREQIRAGASILQNLAEDQGYSWEELDFTLEWMIDNLQRRFRGHIQSVGLITHVIGEALKEKMGHEQKQKQRQERVEQERQDERRVAQRNLLEKHLAALSSTEQQRLRQEAIDSLTTQGVKAEFMLESLVKSEMSRLFENRNPLAFWRS
jgi:hypothetical protein